MPSSTLVAKRNALDAKRKELAEVFDVAGTDIDFTKKEVLDKLGAKDSAEAVEKVRERNREIEALYEEARKLADVERIRDELIQGSAPPAPHADPDRAQAPVALGTAIVNSAAYNAYRASKNPSAGEVKGYGLREIKNVLFQTGAGWAPESVRSGLVVEAATRPIQVIDIIPAGTTDQAAYVYMQETVRAPAAGGIAEGGNYGEAQFQLTQVVTPVVKIGDSIPVTDEQLEDVAGAESYLNSRLTFGVRQAADAALLVGAGGQTFTGILNTLGIQTQAKGADPTPDAVYKAMTLVQLNGRAFPNYVLLHPLDWQDIRLARTADGIYIWGSPSEAGPERIWGLPVIKTDILAQSTGLVGDFNFCMMFDRRGMDLQVGYVNAQFTQGQKTIRADMRAAFAVFRPAAFATVTGI